MKHIDEPRLEEDLGYRFEYLCDFIGFGEAGIAAIHGSAPLLAPLVGGLVDAVYVKLSSYDSTKRHFVPRQHGYDGDVPADLDALTLDHEQIAFRKKHLTGYLVKLVTAPYNAGLVKYLDLVGRVHTAKAGSAKLHIPLVQMNALMGFVSDAFVATILGLGLDVEAQATTLRASTSCCGSRTI